MTKTVTISTIGKKITLGGETISNPPFEILLGRVVSIDGINCQLLEYYEKNNEITIEPIYSNVAKKKPSFYRY